MTKLAIITTAALLSASTVALADPDVTVRDHRDHGDRYDNRDDNRYDDRYDDRFDNSDSKDDTDRMYFDDDDDGEARFTHDQDGSYWRGDKRFERQNYQPRWVSLGSAGTGKTGIRVGAELGRFQSVKLAVNGYMRIRQVVVQFADGTSQRVRMSSAMTSRTAPLVIDLGGKKRIERIFVYAAQFGRGTVSLSGLEAKKFFWRRMRDR